MSTWNVESKGGLLQRITFKQLLSWEAYGQIEPFGDMLPNALAHSSTPTIPQSPRAMMDRLKGIR